MNTLMANLTSQSEKTQEILFVDDEIKIHKGLQRLFQQNKVPWKYMIAESVDDALAILQEHDIDTVITDLHMPNKDGFEFLSLLRKNQAWNDIPVVILTGLDNPELKIKALDMGAIDLLHKPLTPDYLLARINSILHIKRSQDVLKKENAHLSELVCQKIEALEATQLDLVWRLGRAAEFRNTDPGNHVIRTGYYSKILAESMGLAEDFSETIFLASFLHDLGKIGISGSIVLKPGSLTDSESKILRTHCQIGEALLSTRISKKGSNSTSINSSIGNMLDSQCNHFLQMAANIAGHHHEQWNGYGYPYGKKKEAIPLSARIVSISDVYDSLRSKRTYKPGIEHHEAIAIMRKENGFRFDPNVFSYFEQNRSAFQDIYHQHGDTNSQGAISEPTVYHRIT